MEITKQQEELLGQLIALVKQSYELPQKEKKAAIELMKSFGITRLAFWSEFFSPENLTEVKYNEEDQELFGKLEPDFWLEPDYMRGDECLGQVFAAEIGEKGEELNLVICDTFHDEVFTAPYDHVSSNVDALHIYSAIFKSIQFNLDNNIPVEKWDVAHYGYVDPYTYEYLG